MTTLTIPVQPVIRKPCDEARDCFDQAATRLALDEATRQLLRSPLREFHAQVPVRMDDGRVRVFRGIRVQHNDARGPSQSGIRLAVGAGLAWPALEAVAATAVRHDVPLREAVYLLAVSRVAEACRSRGWV